jgi:GPI-anchor transamidase subunit GAA1
MLTLTSLLSVGLGYLKILAPPDKVLRWIEAKLNLLGRLPHYVSIDQKTYGRYGVLPSTSTGPAGEHAVAMGWIGSAGGSGGGQRLGP